ncbi:tRNA uridine-5-carboxymethylaminomethyl(34) synthesis enzyme MnmG [bacterium]|nr:tRNA uridine-5-carboxymethylaminomethyl(34) synthesis enzyme MnmG [bacterium]
MTNFSYDIIVVGGGHAGAEAVLACNRLNCKVALITSDPSKMGVMPCNPSIGGPAKSHLVREIDALGGEMGKAIDDTFIHIRRLNTGKGQAVQAIRAQADRPKYNDRICQAIERSENVNVISDTVIEIMSKNNVIKGVKTMSGLTLSARAVIVCTGTFLAGTLHLGKLTLAGGRSGEAPAFGLSRSLRNLGLNLMRLKTGTCPRLHKKSIDFSSLDVLPPTKEPLKFSDMSDEKKMSYDRQVSCYITRTNEETRKVIVNNLHHSPLYDGSGAIVGVWPRYCPSIEDKFVRFPDREVHLVFLEPEGFDVDEVYLQGVSTSMPLSVQYGIVRSLPGLENADIIRPGYAVEYDCVKPDQLDFSLGVRNFKGLYLAGQINGTSGYEEAASQGLIAAINAVRYLDGKEPFIVGRDQGYVGVLIDDLVCKGTSEPYRMHTSRAEYRLLLREDNADDRLTPQAREMGLISDMQWQKYLYFKNTAMSEINRLKSKHLNAEMSQTLREKFAVNVSPGPSYAELLHRPDINLSMLRQVEGLPQLELRLTEKIESLIVYSGYIERQNRDVKRVNELKCLTLDSDIIYKDVIGMSSEAVEKLSKYRPYNVDQASRISGVSPSDLRALMVYLRANVSKNN